MFKEGDLAGGVVQFLHKKETKIGNIKWQKSLETKMFFSAITKNSKLGILTKNLVTFER